MKHKFENSRVYLMDCIEGMKQYPDKHFHLAIVDPPYGIGEDGEKNHSRVQLAKPTLYKAKNWDNEPPSDEYFIQLKRVSKHQIIFGANHFIERFTFNRSTPCWIVWDKDNSGDFADCELAWASFNTAVRKFTFRWNGMLQGDMKNKEHRIHPTQKPVALYEWLLHNYAKQGDKILDTHLGSQSSRIAAYKNGFDFTGFELDAEYFEKGNKRFDEFKSQLRMF
jgi:site-specific DNA-methyltransferase (adenine-specific)